MFYIEIEMVTIGRISIGERVETWMGASLVASMPKGLWRGM
jgi:hypothetical protein